MKNAKIYVIPNQAVRADQWLAPSVAEQKRSFVEKVAELSGLSYDNEDKLIELGYVDFEGTEDSMEDSIFGFDNNGKTMYTRITSAHLPYKWFENLKEGDSIDITFPINALEKANGICYEYNLNSPGEKMNLTIHCILDQTTYGYRRFGKFEEVAKQVL